MGFWIYVIVTVILASAFNHWMDRRGTSRTYKRIGIIAIVVIIIGHLLVIERWGNTQIGSYFERAEYTEYYYVHLFRGADSSNNEYIPAKIKATNLEDSVQESDGSESASSFRAYFIDEAYLENGSIIKFHDYELYGEDVMLVPYQRIRVPDDQGAKWYIELTTTKAQDKKDL